jgi:hypothetical protein
MAGLNYVLSVNPTVKIYAPKEGFGIYGSSLLSSFYRKDESLPPEMRYYGGAPPQIMKFGAAWQGANIELIDKTTEIAPGMTLIASEYYRRHSNGQRPTHHLIARNVGFSLNSGPSATLRSCLFCAKLGHSAVYSITSSARARRVAGTCKPNSLADSWLITNSNSVGA